MDLDIIVYPVDDPAEVTLSADTNSYAEDATPVVIDSAVSVTDVDSTTLTRAGVVITENFEAGTDILSFTDTATITGSYDATTGVLILSGTDTVAAYEAALSSVTYHTTSDEPDTQDRTILFNVDDGAGFGVSDTIAVSVSATNDAPVLTDFPLEFEVDEDITQDINFYDLEPFGETFTDPDAGDNVVEFTFTLSSGVLTFPPGGAGITISGNMITGTVAAINDYLNNGGTDGTFVRFTTDLNSTEDVSLNITVNDLGNTGSGGSLSDSVDLDIIVYPVDDPAEVTLSADTNSYAEDATPVVIDSAVSVTDVDSTTLTRAGVVITENFEAGTDILSFTDTATITGSYDATTGVLILSGTDTVAAYEAALSSVTYHTTSDEPDTQDRTILFNVDDGAGFGVSDTIAVSVSATNDAPVLTDFPLEFEVDEDITQDINFYDLEPFGETFTDPDAGDNVVEFTFTLSSGVLTFPPGGAGITISGNMITGTVAAINDYLNNGGTDGTFVRFTTDLNSTEDVSLNITVNDLGNTGSGGSLSDSVDLDIIVYPVDDPAEVTLSADTNSYAEDATPVVIDSAVSVIDVDSTTLTRAGVVITENFEAGTDILSFTDTATITGSYDATTGVLILSGTDTVAAYEAALSSVTYHTTSDEPDTQDRTILFNVDDGAGFGVSDTIAVSVSATNDAPVLTDFPLEFEVDEDITQDINFYDLEPFGETFTDPDAGDNVVEFTFTLSSGVLTFPPGGAGITISGNMITGTVAAINDYLNNGGTDGTFVRFTTDLNSTEDVSLNITVNDLGNTGSGGSLSDSVDLDIIVYPVDDPAEVTLSADTNSYAEDATPVVIDSAVSVTDVDSTTLTRAGVVITENFEAGTDILSFTDTATITGSYDATTGVLILSGTDTVAAYEAALSSVTYHTTSDEPDTQDRTILFNVGDGAGFGVSDTIAVSVSATNDAPRISFDSVAASAEQIVNGGFEEGNYYAESDNIFSNGNTDISNWTVTDDDVQYLKDSTGSTVGEGERAVSLNGNEPGAISTTISTTIGQTYEVTFQGLGDGTLEVVASGGTTENYEFDSDSNIDFYSYVFTATESETTLTFTSTTAGDDGPTLDDVTVREIVGGTFDVVEDTPIEISDIQITDVDADAGATFTVILSAGYGLLTVNDSVQGGVNDINVSNNGTYSVTLTGTLDQINETLAAVDGVTYTPNLDSNSPDSLVVTVDDGGSSGSGGAQTATASITLNVQPVDDSAPASSDVGDIVAGTVANLTGIQFVGDDGDTVGNSVTNVGDINNDGIDDFAIGASATSGDSGTPTFSGSVYVVYGIAGENPYASYANSAGEVNLDDMVAVGRGFELVGAASGDQAGFSVSGGGDINNDGISDIVVGAYFADTPNLNSGTSYVVYGGQNFSGLADSTTGEISLDTVGVTGTSGSNLDGFKFEHTDSNANLGYDVSLTGDLNGDGISDFVVSSVGSSTGTSGYSSSYIGTWVVFGGQDFASATGSSTGAFDVTDIGSGGSIDGFLLTGEAASDSAGLSIDVVGDVNGDGIDDLLVGAPNEDSGASQGGASYLIYGGQDWESLKSDTFPEEVSLGQLGTSAGDLQGFKIQSGFAGENLGTTVSDAGDVNGDGTADLLVTALGASTPGVTSAAYLIHGGQSLSGTVSASLIGSGGTGSVDGHVFTESVAGDSITHATALGDIDGDGYSDILIGVKTADDGVDMNTGKSYVVYGSRVASSSSSSLSDIAADGDGFEIIGEAAGDLFGTQAQSVGDVNSDGYSDFIVTAIGNDDGGPGAGAAYLIYGSDFEDQAGQVSGADTETGSVGSDLIHGTEGNDVIVGGGGRDVIITGAGDDTITINDDTVAYVDGGSGADTLIFDDAGSFDLTNIGDERLHGIEALDTTNGEVNDVTLGITDIFQITEDSNADLETLLSDVLPTSFIIDADANDTYTFENGSAGGVWTLNVAKSAGVPDYDVYEYVESGSTDVLATLAIDDDVTPTIV